MCNAKNIFFLILAVTLLAACTGNRDKPVDVPLAQVDDKKLFLSEVKGLIPDELSPADSTLMAEDYIKKWILKELLIKKAEFNLTPAQKDVTKEIEEYRNSIITYRYKKEMISQKLDTTVTYDEIAKYYSENSGNFILGFNIVRAIFIKIPIRMANPEQLKLYCSNHSPQNLSDLKDYCLRYAKVFDTFSESWVEFDVVLKNIPKTIDDQEQFLKRNSIIELRDREYYYLVYLNDYRLAGDNAPVDYVREKVRNLILNKRKIDFLKKIENEIYQDGVRNNKFKIFNIED